MSKGEYACVCIFIGSKRSKGRHCKGKISNKLKLKPYHAIRDTFGFFIGNKFSQKGNINC